MTISMGCGWLNNVLRVSVALIRYSAELISQPAEESKPPSATKRTSSRKRIMSMVGGMPYRKVYVPQGEERIAPSDVQKSAPTPGIVSLWRGDKYLSLTDSSRIDYHSSRFS